MRASSLVCQSVIFGSVLAMSAVTGRKMWTARASSHSSLNPGHFGLRRAGLASGSHISCLGASSGHRQIRMRAIDGGIVEVPLQWPCALRVGCELWRCEVKIPGVSSAERWTKCPDARCGSLDLFQAPPPAAPPYSSTKLRSSVKNRFDNGKKASYENVATAIGTRPNMCR